MTDMKVLVVYPPWNWMTVKANANRLKESYAGDDVNVCLEYFDRRSDTLNRMIDYLRKIKKFDAVYFTGEFRFDVTCMNQLNLAIKYGKNVIYDGNEKG